ncbi:hypothetical protein Mal64_17880 [Pseudobythopirellula maris]|uniref:Uncharacterized protein n=1 Tax=Pseudobythopirellula maris TaxID=2527991 RepID=A0A5C5ZLN1_9BACT|nr:hypothetical protein [Pseudobythopirellula maris]TWT88309.1 hypothetical protein Mal64_17880 [Pseudobythopirellula maris]
MRSPISLRTLCLAGAFLAFGAVCRAEQNEFLLPAMAGRIEAFELSSLAPATAAQSTAETASASPARWTAPLGVELNLSEWTKPSDSPNFRRFARSGFGMAKAVSLDNNLSTSLTNPAPTSSSHSFSSDFGDLHEFNVFYDNVLYHEALSELSFELAKQFYFSEESGINGPNSGWRIDAFASRFMLQAGEEVRGEASLPASEACEKWWESFQTSTYASCGLRMVRLSSDFEFDASGSILGRTYIGQFNDHDIFGPQLGLGAVAESERLRFEATVLGLAGYGRARLKQNGVFGAEAIPGALNRSASARTTNSTYDATEEHFAWHFETRLSSSYTITPGWRIDALYRWYLAGPVYDAAGGTIFSVPYFGYNAKAGVGQASEVFLGLAYTL